MSDNLPRAAIQYTLPSEKVVTLMEPTVKDILLAESTKDSLAILRNCIVRIDDQEVSYVDLRNNGLSDRLSAKDIVVLGMMVADLTVPSEDEVAKVKGSARAISR